MECCSMPSWQNWHILASIDVCDIFKSIVYADDTSLISTLSAFDSHGENTASDNLNEEPAKIIKSLKFNQLSLNVTKSKFMLFHMPGRNLQIPIVRINNIKLECSDSFDFLDITMDKHLTWKYHINLIANKISRTVGVTNRFKNYTPQNVLLTIYNTNNTTFKLWNSYMGI